MKAQGSKVKVTLQEEVWGLLGSGLGSGLGPG